MTNLITKDEEDSGHLQCVYTVSITGQAMGVRHCVVPAPSDSGGPLDC